MSIVDQSMDGILGLLFQGEVSNFQFIIFCCYLPPEDSPWGHDSDSFYAHLLDQIYIHNYVDTYFIFGDPNGRIGNHSDFTRDVDHLPNRRIIVKEKNKHGEALIDFLFRNLMITHQREHPLWIIFSHLMILLIKV